MKTNISQMPGYKMNDYLVVLAPPEGVREKILHTRDEFKKNNKGAVVNTRPYLVLVKFNTWEMMEERIIQKLQVIGMSFTPFKIQMKDFGAYPSHSIYINVITRLPVLGLIKELKSAQKLMRSPQSDAHFMEDPQFHLATRLASGLFEKAWLEYSHRHFTASFIADGMLLLKKGDSHSRFEVVRRFDFLNLPVGTKQGELF